jgi:hypothetical protein
VGGVTLHRLHQIGHEILALLELDVDVGEGAVGVLAKRHQAIVGADHHHHQDDDDRQDENRHCPHFGFPETWPLR